MTDKPPFAITISRQLGSGGACLGQMLARELNIFYADREIIRRAAERLATYEEMLESRDEKVSSFWQSCLESFGFAAPETYIPPVISPSELELFEAESEVIRTIANECSAVIIGRCGSQILYDHPDHLKVFLHADPNFRKKRIRELYGISEEEAATMVVKSDRERGEYVLHHTGIEWTDSRHYDLSIDTGRIGFDGCLELILKCVEYRKSCRP